jgi:dTDP-4-dehydrorhamnose 3,5-epimerase
MQITKLPLEGVLLIEPDVFFDERGFFLESYNETRFMEAGITTRFVQDNHSMSNKGVLRGLHYQRPPYDQGKLVRVVRGAVTDVVVDIRKSSPGYGKFASVSLTDENRRMLWIPPGFAHGFLALADNTVFLYKCTKVYNKSSENGILWNDPDLAINWNWEHPLVSAKDLELGTFRELISEF